MLKKLFFTAVSVVIASAAMTAPVRADVIGIAVAGIPDAGLPTQVGSHETDGTINFFIPLSGTGTAVTYGVVPLGGGAASGTTSDSCVYGSTGSSSCSGGLLEMILYFSPVEVGPGELSLLFTDLDIDGVNDPWFFLETLQILDSSGGLLHTIDVSFLNDPTDRGAQQIDLGISITTQPDFYLRLVMGTAFTYGYYGATYTNTEEHLLATIVSVPEPSTLFLFGTGLLLVAGYRRRQMQSGI